MGKRKIKLLSLELIHFKGQTRKLNFPDYARIKGTNGTGKTALFDSYTWLLINKDSMDRAVFGIQPYDPEGTVNNDVFPTVIGRFVDNTLVVTELQKTLKVKWEGKRGTTEKKLKTTIEYKIDGVAKNEKEYNQFIEHYFASLSIIPLLIDPMYFCGPNYLWSSRRSILTEIAGNITLEELVKLNPKLAPIVEWVRNKDIKTLEGLIAAELKKNQEAKEPIPARIEENSRNIIPVENIEAVNALIQDKENRIKAIDEQLQSSVDTDSANKKNELRGKIDKIASDVKLRKSKALLDKRIALQTAEIKLQEAKRQPDKLRADQKKNETAKEITSKELEELRAKWSIEDAKVFVLNDEELICPTCKRMLEHEKAEEEREKMKGNFNETKAKTLNRINEDGQKKKEELELLQKQIELLTKKIADAETDIATQQDNVDKIKAAIATLEKENEHIEETVIDFGAEYFNIKDELAALESIVKPDVSELKEKLNKEKSSLQDEIKSLSEKIEQDKNNKKYSARIEELKEEESVLASRIAELEQQQFLLKEYTKEKIKWLDARINGHFSNVKFKLFGYQKNGGFVECCDALIGGVPFPYANNAGRYNGGIDIINTLTNFFGVSLPIFIDNAEGIVELLPTDSQVIELVVTRGCPTLTIEQ
jgi:hypothetical protein